MHDSAYECCVRFRDKYINPKEYKNVLDVGSFDVNGTLKPIFQDDYNYVGLDIVDGPNVDVFYDPPIHPFSKGFFDVAVSSSCFEHDPMFWVTFKEMCRVTKGYIFLCAPSSGPYHKYPGDCWRFYGDAWDALARWANVRLVEQYMCEDMPWRDNVGIFDTRLMYGDD